MFSLSTYAFFIEDVDTLIKGKSFFNLVILGDHGVEQIDCRRHIHLHDIINQRQLNRYTDQYSGTSFSFVFYPKSGYEKTTI